MIGIGTIVNVLCIIGGGLVGMGVGQKLTIPMRETVLTMTGVAIFVLGLGGTLSHMLVITDEQMTTTGTLMLVLSLSIGAIIGEALQLEERIIQFGEGLKIKSRSDGDNAFVTAFVTASCTVCIGAMAIMGAIQDGISGDYSILVAKGVIDSIIICIMTASLGKGCIFSAIPVGLVQGMVTLLAVWGGNVLSDQAIHDLSLVGSVLILCVGINLMRTKQIRIANVLPALVIAILWSYVFP